ncbi:aldose epimerase family protein [Pedobacter zeae]|uniref:Aldose 1-epimerase n=1 Tax=Pedobacter zeae TaxID=1737356 RepID=A0A7W6KAR0_9SPHI|nr:aldose epimerase family protein [Pedobacter zeae]MBB4107270.1 aldose 1-epimerase [Pedobacter zeae]GGH06796.1 aldose 1-epimerase [Pedobacter zeae]
MTITHIKEDNIVTGPGVANLIKISNKHGASISLSNYGASLVSAIMPDKNGLFADVVLGFTQLEDYFNDQNYLGATIGRFANRIAQGRFVLDGKTFQLDVNDGANINHSGASGFSNKLFYYEVKGNKVLFRLYSKEGEGGFPGDLHCTVSYELTDKNEILIDFKAHSNQKTIVSFTNHAYFNLSGKHTDIFDHRLSIPSTEMLEMNKDYLPTGMIIPVGKNAFSGQPVASVMAENDNKGLNNYYLLAKKVPAELVLAAELLHEISGRRLKVFTDSPGVLLYTGDFLNTAGIGHHGKPYVAFNGLCLECQHYPDAPNQPIAPAVAIEKGAVYQQKIIYQFDTIQR